MEDEKKVDFQVDIKKIVDDLATQQNVSKEQETKMEEYKKKIEELEKENEDFKTKNTELTDANAKLYLQVAQSMTTNTEQKQEENKKDDTLSVEDLVNKLQF